MQKCAHTQTYTYTQRWGGGGNRLLSSPRFQKQFQQSGKGLPQTLEKPFVFTIWSFWRGEPRTSQLDVNSWLIQEAYLICDQYSSVSQRKGRASRCRAQLPRWNNLFFINLLHVVSHFSQSFQMCYKRLHALGPESMTAVVLKGKKIIVDYKLWWAFPAHMYVLTFKSSVPSSNAEQCSAWNSHCSCGF